MKKGPLLFYLITFLTVGSFAQGQVIDTGVAGKFPFVEGGKLSDDGKFALYFVAKANSRDELDRTLSFNSLTNDWKLEVGQVKPDAKITTDGKYGVFLNKGDSLGIVKLKYNNVQYIPDIRSYDLVNDWVICKRRSKENEIVVRRLPVGKDTVISNVVSYLLNTAGCSILLQLKDDSSRSTCKLVSFDLRDKRSYRLWQGRSINSWCADEKGGQVGFTAEGDRGNELWICSIGDKTQETQLLATNTSPGIPQGSQIASVQEFVGAGNKILFRTSAPKRSAVYDTALVKMNIWSFTDTKLPAFKSGGSPAGKSYLSVINIENGNIRSLESDSAILRRTAGEVALMQEKISDVDIGERNWNVEFQNKYYLLSLNTGVKEIIVSSSAVLSPKGKYLFYYDKELQEYFSYSVAQKDVKNVTKSITAFLADTLNSSRQSSQVTYSVVGWLNDDQAVLLQDGNDIWELDLSGERKAVNLTNGYGRKNKIIFYPAHHDANPFIIARDEELLLTGFRKDNKQNGLFRKKAGTGGDPQKLVMGDYLFFVPHQHLIDVGMCPQKARNGNMFLVMRMRAGESPNYFYTRDFEKLRPLTNVYPERKYNWLKSELVTWELGMGLRSSGILYKPDNFDPTRKYPVIFYYYEELSDNLNFFLRPELSYGPLNIPWFVSRGYLVFTPDIHCEKGHPGESALKTVLSAAKYLSQLPYVDSAKIGLQGHSFGGFETNYIVAHTGIFAAACTAAGISDLLSFYSGVYQSGVPRQGITEIGQMRMGHTPWDSMSLYFENSPLQRADKITTPLLLMHNDKDNAVPFDQGLFLFTALRRLGKRSWLLQYEQEGHILSDKAVAKDYTIRMTQFFDHYLRGRPAPKWMTNRMKISRDEIYEGLELNTGNVGVGKGLLRETSGK